MKKHLILTAILLSLFSCSSSKIEELNHKITELEAMNDKLVDSLTLFEKEKFTSSKLLVIPDKTFIKVNEPNKMNGLIFKFQEFHKFNLYQLDTLDYNMEDKLANNSKLLLKDQTKSHFEFEYTPKSKSDSIIYLLIKTKVGNTEIEMPAIYSLNTTQTNYPKG